jgi:hypothetical protein
MGCINSKESEKSPQQGSVSNREIESVTMGSVISPTSALDGVGTSTSLEMVEKAVNVINSIDDGLTKTNEALSYAQEAYNVFKCLPLSQVTSFVDEKAASSFMDVVSVVGKTVFTSVFPSLLEIGKTVPFLGPVAAIALQLYEAVNQYIQNSKDLQDLIKLVTESITWLKQTGRMIEKLDPQTSGVFLSKVQSLICYIGEARELAINWQRPSVVNTVSQVAFADYYEKKIYSLSSSLKEIQGGICLFAIPVLYELSNRQTISKEDQEMFDELFKETFTRFEFDIDTHLSRFVKGSRQWMHAVRLYLLKYN